MAQVPMDRLKGALRSLARGAFPEAIYAHVHRAKLVAQKSSLRRVDVVPYDARLPPMSNVPLKVGVPGVEVKLPPGADVWVGWEDARPDRPYVTEWAPGTGGSVPLRTQILAMLLELGGDGSTPLVAPKDGLVHGQGIDSFLGVPYWMLGNSSTVVLGRKG